MRCLEAVASGSNFPAETDLSFNHMQINTHHTGQLVRLGLCDTRVGEDWTRLRVLLYPGTDFFWICFSIANVDSFYNIRDIYLPEVRHHCPHTPFILVGLASDLREDEEAKEEVRRRNQDLVSTEEATDLAQSLDAVCYVECSAKQGQGIEELRSKSAELMWNLAHPKTAQNGGKTLSKCSIQ